MGEISWADEDARHIRSRSARYPGALNIDPAWTAEVLDDDALAVLDPDPKSRVSSMRMIGFSPSAGRVLTVVAYRDLRGVLHGVSAWPATRADLALYEGRS